MFTGFPKRRLAALTALPGLAGLLLRALAAGNLRRAGALLLALPQLLLNIVGDAPITPYKATIDMDRFSLVWADEFDHGFDTSVWQGHYVYGADDTQPRDIAWWNRDQVSFTEDGCLVLTVEYKENGPAGAHYYSYGMETNPNKNYSGDHVGYEQLYGYFEIRCILPRGKGLNPAFWLLTDGMWADDTDGGVSGAEVDVFETMTDQDPGGRFYGSVFHTIHVDAYGDAHRQEHQGWYLANDPYNTFNTYGVAWDPDGYTFYINGVETAHTDFGGVCAVPLYLIISVGVDERIAENTQLPARMIVDYVRAYQFNKKG